MKAYEAGRDVQLRTQSGEKVDGKAVWQTLEKPVENIDIPEMKYNDSLNTIYEKIDEIDKEFNMSDNENNPISNHFLLQLRNLVVKKSNFIIKINRILQLGFNAGQLSIFIEQNTLPQDRINKIRKIFYKYKLNELETYISKDKLENIDKIFDKLHDEKSKQSGGNINHYNKYIKYKQKYLKLKNNQ